ncbi:hypothetical protein CH295_26165 [Rhodococcus sp. 14-2483-1-2]|nr:hypothetical protein CH295_26165 [Rhodococcus sp. 14-2483-1-2]
MADMVSNLGATSSTRRVALTWLVASGDLDRSEGIHQLCLIHRTTARPSELRAVAGGGGVTAWPGSWRPAVVTTGSENFADRADLRTTLREVWFGELREGVLGSTNNISSVPRSRQIEKRITADPGAILMARALATKRPDD